MAMAQGTKAEIITILDNSLTNTSNFDSYFSSLIDGWDTEIILLFKKDLSNYVANCLVGGWSSYAITKNSGTFAEMWRETRSKIQQITRNDWTISVVPGDEYYVIRFGSQLWF